MMAPRAAGPVASSAVGVDVGGQSVRVVELRRAGRGIVLAKWATAKLAPHEADLQAVVQRLFREQRLRRRPLALAMPGGMAFVRVVKPIVSGRLSLEQAMRFEAQHVVPFPLTEVLWDYHRFDPAASPPLALLVAVKQDLVEQRMRAAGASRAGSAVMDLAPLAVYNAMRLAYPRALAPGHAILHIGTHTADLILLGRQQFWVRSVPIGGDRLTEAIMRTVGVPVEQAERIKLRQETAALDAAALAEAIAPVLEELAGEIRRSIDYFRQQEPEQLAGGAPAESPEGGRAAAAALTQLWLSGAAARTEGLAAFLQERLGCPAQLVAPHQTLTLGCPTPPPNPEAYSVAIGLALRGLGAQPVQINLLRELAAREQAAAERHLFLASAGVCAVTALAVLGGFLRTTYQTKRAQLDKVDRLLEVYQQYHPKVQGLLDEQARLERHIGAARAIVAQRDRWLRLLRQMRSLIPSGVWLTEFVSSPTGVTAARATGQAAAQEPPPAAAPKPAGTGRAGAGGAEGRAEAAAAAAAPKEPLLQEVYLAGHATSFQGVNELVARLKSDPAFAEVRPLSSSIVKGAGSGEELVVFAIVVSLADAAKGR